VEDKVVNVGGKQRRVDVPVEMPEGVSYEGFFGEGVNNLSDLALDFASPSDEYFRRGDVTKQSEGLQRLGRGERSLARAPGSASARFRTEAEKSKSVIGKSGGPFAGAPRQHWAYGNQNGAAAGQPGQPAANNSQLFSRAYGGGLGAYGGRG